MSKTKRKNRSDTEFLRGYIRELEKEVRSLQKQVKASEKWNRSQDEEIARDSEDTYPDIKKSCECLNCGKGKVVETLEIVGKVYGECDVCGFKGRIA